MYLVYHIHICMYIDICTHTEIIIYTVFLSLAGNKLIRNDKDGYKE